MKHLLNTGKLLTALLAVATLGAGLVSSARADLILFNPTGGASFGGFNPGTSQISSLNFGSGDALAVGAITNGGLQPGTEFQLYYQTKLVSLNGPSGALPGTAYAGLNTAYQITEVASITERVQSVSANNATAVITEAPVQAPGSGVKVYFENLTAPGAVAADANTGVGFNVGTVILTKNLTSSQSNYTDTTKNNGNPTLPLNGLPGGGFAGVTTDQGTGSTTLSLGVVTGYNPAFFVTPRLVTSVFKSNLGNNFDGILASQAFNNPALSPGSSPNIIPKLVSGDNNGTTNGDFLFQVSGATESFAVPEPASFAMAATALGIVPMTIWLRRRRQAKPRLA